MKQNSTRPSELVLDLDQLAALGQALDLAAKRLRRDVELWESARPCDLINHRDIGAMRQLFLDYEQRLKRLRMEFEHYGRVVFVTKDQ